MHTLTTNTPSTRRSSLMRRAGRVLALGAAAAVVGSALAAMPAQAGTENPYQRGPEPTRGSLTDASGPYRWTQRNITGQTGFGGGQVFWPTSGPAGEKYGVIALSPGFTATWSSISWLGGRLAQEGFVVVGIETTTILDQPYQRGQELVAALNWAVNRSPAKDRIDATRQAVGGHSMGGGGTLEAERIRKTIKAGVPLAPWNLNIGWSDVRTPTAIIGGQADVIAPVGQHSLPFYNSLRGPKKYVELVAQSHFFPQFINATEQATMIGWYKRYLDDDTRYTQFLKQRPADASNFLTSGIN